MKKALGLFLAALILLPSPSSAQSITGAIRIAPGGAPAVLPQLPVPSMVLPATVFSSVLPAASLIPSVAPTISAVPMSAAPAAAASLDQAQAALAKPNADSAPVLAALFDAARSAPSAADSSVPGQNGAGLPALAPHLSAASLPSVEPGPGAPRTDYVRAPWRRKITEYKERFVKWVSTTPSEILLIGVLGLGLGLFMGNHHERDREKHIPLGFSEIHQIERDAERADMAVDPLTRYLTSTNDMTMKVFEAWNLSHENTYAGSNVRRFAVELNYKMDPSYKFHKYDIADFTRELPAQAAAASAKLGPLDTLRRGLAPVVNDFDRSWDDSHTDHYRTEIYWVTVRDGDNRSHSEMRTRQVYDYTRHRFDYDRSAGERASSGADRVIAQNEWLSFKEVLHTASQTNAEGEHAAERSRRGSKVKLTQTDLTAIANTWATGSTLMTNLPEADHLWAAFRADAAKWRSAKNSARSDAYNNRRHYDSGPHEFQVAEQAWADGSGAVSKLGEVFDGIDFVKANTPKLEGMIRQLIDIELNGKKSDVSSEKLTREILTLSQTMYQKNFKNGFEVDPYRKTMLLIFALCGMGLGAALGAALDKASRKYRWY